MKPPIGAQASANMLGGCPVRWVIEPVLLERKPVDRPQLRRADHCRRGFTLVEVMVATAITLLIMAAVTALFANISASVQVSRASIELSDRIRAVKALLENDLKGLTAVTVPPMKADDDKGYFEIVEGCVGPVIKPETLTGCFLPNGTPDYYPPTHPLAVGASDPLHVQRTDTTVGDIDDILMFTTRSWEQPFVGKSSGGAWTPNITNPAVSSTAEICWFLRGNTLYRRVLLVLPNHQIGWSTTGQSYYALNDVSARQINGSYDRVLFAGGLLTHSNALGDLTKREYRYGHQPHAWPHDVRYWGALGLPTLQECSASSVSLPNPGGPYYCWPFPMWDSGDTWNANTGTSTGYGTVIGGVNGPSITYKTGMGFIILPKGVPLPPTSLFDAWQMPTPWLSFNGSTGIDPASGNLQVPIANAPTPPFLNNARRAEDLAMANVLSFDVKVWDPGAPIFLDDNLLVAITPDDTRYVDDYLVKFINGTMEKWKSLASFGAYVDLNYMCLSGYRPENNTQGLFTYENALKGWEANLGQSVGLGSILVGTQPRTLFGGPGDPRSGLAGQPPPNESGIPLPGNRTLSGGLAWMQNGIAAVYDSGSDHYEQDGINQDMYFDPTNPWVFSNPSYMYNPSFMPFGANAIDYLVDEGTDGYDNDSIDPLNAPTVHVGSITPASQGVSRYGESGVDDATEKEAPPPYKAALRGVQIKIRCFEPDSRQIVEVTVVQDFLP